MKNKTMLTLEFDKILEMLSEYAISENSKNRILSLELILNETELRLKQKETTEAKIILESIGTAPICTMQELENILSKIEFGGMLEIQELEMIAEFINTSNRLRKYLEKAESLNVGLAFMGKSIGDLNDVYDEIDTSIRNGVVLDSASNVLRDIRRKIENEKSQIKAKLEQTLKANKNIFSESYIFNKNGHWVLAVKKECKNQLKGNVIDQSNTGSTFFIEPENISKIQSELQALEIEEDNEVRRILYILTGYVIDNKDILKSNIKIMEELDFIFAKAKLSIKMKAKEPEINHDRIIEINQGRHPLLDQELVVPMNFVIGNGINGIIITGPNTGGKTVTLKTIGLFLMMAQTGLHVPAQSANICMNNAILCDIGDGQSITENLSTFSAHITNIIEILKHSDEESIVLLDELGSGTDPQEGMGIAISILEELKKKGCLFVATTHYPEVKEYTAKSSQLLNARMLFDKETMKPTYTLEIGEAGESCAIYIAKKLGLPRDMLKMAYKQAYNKELDNQVLEGCIDKIEPSKMEKIIKPREIIIKEDNVFKYKMGDSVIVYPKREIGIVYKPADDKGIVCVQIKGKKQMINHKRLKLKNNAEELYPEDYDFSIIFDTKSNRKARHQMGKHHIEGLVIEDEE